MKLKELKGLKPGDLIWDRHYRIMFRLTEIHKLDNEWEYIVHELKNPQYQAAANGFNLLSTRFEVAEEKK
jgi:hypothetical protein